MVGLVALAGGVLLLRRRPIIVRLTSTALHLRGVVIPWTAIRSLERVRSGRNYWIGIHLKEKRTDLDSVALKAQSVLRALRDRCADFDYAILETDLPRSGVWFVAECERRMAAAGGGATP